MFVSISLLISSDHTVVGYFVAFSHLYFSYPSPAFNPPLPQLSLVGPLPPPGSLSFFFHIPSFLVGHQIKSNTCHVLNVDSEGAWGNSAAHLGVLRPAHGPFLFTPPSIQSSPEAAFISGSCFSASSLYFFGNFILSQGLSLVWDLSTRRLTGHWAPGICLPPSLQHCDYKYMRSAFLLFFKHVQWYILGIKHNPSRLNTRHFTNWAVPGALPWEGFVQLIRPFLNWVVGSCFGTWGLLNRRAPVCSGYNPLPDIEFNYFLPRCWLSLHSVHCVFWKQILCSLTQFGLPVVFFFFGLCFF